MAATAPEAFAARAVLEGAVLDERAIRDEEIARSRHALAYLKARIGNAAMRELLDDDIARTKARVRDWVERSNGRWWTAQVELTVPGPSAEAFHRWYERAIAERREAVLRAAHPEHFVVHPADDGIEVVENVGETELPWCIVYRTLPDDAFPLPWAGAYLVRFGAKIVDGDACGSAIPCTTRDADDGLHLLLRTLLPEAASPTLVERHLRHFAIKFVNSTRVTWLQEQDRASS